MKKTRWHSYLVFALFCIVVYFPLFLHLDWEPLHAWDESLYAMRAGYMAEEGKYLPNYSFWVENGSLHQNSKPPFTSWVQALSMKILGINELALRLPIALCALTTVFLLVFFSKKQLGDVNAGYCAGFILVTSAGYIRAHAARTGDQDAALALYMLAGAFAFYHYIEATTNRQRYRWLALLTFLLIISALTKYVFGLFFLPAFFLYAIYKKEWLNILRRGSTWLAALSFLTVTGGWLMIMEQRIPGFTDRALFYEMMDRYATVIENHTAPWNYYFVSILNGYFMPWLLLLPLPLAIIFLKKDQPLRDVLVLLFLCVAVLLLTVSFSKTKTTHYEVVAYPPLALLAGTGLNWLRGNIVRAYRRSFYPAIMLLSGVILAIFLVIMPYKRIIEKVYMPVLAEQDLKYGYLLKKIAKHQPDITSFKLLHGGFDAQALFYAGLFNRKKGYHIQLSINPEQVKEGEIIASCDQRSIDYLVEKFELKILQSYDPCFMAEVLQKKVK
jgi:4-amino-4-deoxy-L-arabinose transferase-like glycosyltransferase